MGEANPKFKPGQDFTLNAGATITGGQLLMVSNAADNTVIPTSGVVSGWLGVAAQDAASGENTFAGAFPPRTETPKPQPQPPSSAASTSTGNHP